MGSCREPPAGHGVNLHRLLTGQRPPGHPDRRHTPLASNPLAIWLPSAASARALLPPPPTPATIPFFTHHAHTPPCEKQNFDKNENTSRHKTTHSPECSPQTHRGRANVFCFRKRLRLRHRSRSGYGGLGRRRLKERRQPLPVSVGNMAALTSRLRSGGRHVGTPDCRTEGSAALWDRERGLSGKRKGTEITPFSGTSTLVRNGSVSRASRCKHGAT